MKLYLIRHGMTKGNLERRYVGFTDEELLTEERERLQKKKPPAVETLYVSPMLRCVETAELLYPGLKYKIEADFRECDFGMFEYRNYEELSKTADYQKFVDSMGESGFPGGETKSAFQRRCVFEMEKILSEQKEESSLGFVVHGGTIMALLDWYSNPHRDYYEWQTKNGTGYSAMAEKDLYGHWTLTNIREMHLGGDEG